MKDERKNQSNRALNIALGILLVTWTVLLALMIFIFVVRLQGYENFKEWQHRNDPPVTGQPEPTPTAAPTETPTMTPTLTPTPTPVPTETPTPTPTPVPTETPTPVPTETLAPTPTNTPTSTPTNTPMPTEALTFLEGLRIAGEESIDAEIRKQALRFAEDETAVLVYEAYENGNYLSVVFHKAAEFEGESVDTLLPLVFDLTTKKQLTGSDLIKESYFAIIKERLQTYVAENFPAAEGTDFITYKEIYQEEDYQKFFITEENLVFWFEGNTLLPEGQKPFAYQVPLTEAVSFFYNNMDGTKSGLAIRELDPNKPMIAFTFDDGPFPKVENQLVELFNSYNGKATFFYVVQRIDDWYPKAAKTVYDAGFEVASHTYSHTVNFGQTSESKKGVMWQEFNKANEVLARVTGHAPDYARLPGGTVGPWAKEFPVPFVNWNNDSVDYKYKNYTDGGQQIADLMMEKTYQDGDIVLYHSIYQTSYDSLVILLEYLDAQGFQFVTLSEMFYYKGLELKDGVVHYDGLGDTNEN